jgi:crotonobetainyl-CoA:carnitine CoA-transferase CaiB-like acyl-CoA transferase
VIKVEPPSGDYIRQMSWPIIEGNSLLHLHISCGKRSVFLDLVRAADALVEAMRPGGLARRGLGFDALKEVNPKI